MKLEIINFKVDGACFGFLISLEDHVYSIQFLIYKYSIGIALRVGGLDD